MSSAFEQTF